MLTHNSGSLRTSRRPPRFFPWRRGAGSAGQKVEQTAPGVVRKTPLNAVHRALGARMVAFGGWDMPVEYSGLIAEHLAVREAAGLFDVSHMGEFEVAGEGALRFLQRTTSNDVAKLADGQGQYTAFPRPNGAPTDDAVLYRFS